MKSQLLSMIHNIIYHIRTQNYHEGSLRFQELLGKIQEDEDIRVALCEEESVVLTVISQMLQAMEKTDMLLVADLLEEAFVPLLKEMIVPGEAIESDNYYLEYTSSGYLTVRHLVSDLYLHSNGNPMEEARLLVEHCYNPDKEHYAVWGIGLGYHIAKLYEAARGAIFITVFEEDPEILQIAKDCGILDSVPAERLNFVVDESGRKFAEYISEWDAGVLVHFPSVKKIQDKVLRERMHRFFAGWNSTIQLRTELAVNFRSNLKNCHRNVDELAFLFKDKEVVVVAAGPSLDQTIDFLRENIGKKTIVAVTTVLKKLLQLGIVPDCTVVMDSQRRTVKQIEGIEAATVPMIVDSTACWEFADRYAGEKYIAWQRGYSDAEKHARELGNNVYETGGSVTTLALDVALQLEARAVYLVGVDLAYPNGVSHADNTMDRQVRDTSGMEKVKSVNGEWVYADKLFVKYRQWIEGKLAEYSDVPCYNLSDCGAKIQGTIKT